MKRAMHYDSNLVRFFILASMLSDVIILTIIVRRRLLHETTWFSIYLAVDVAASIVSFAAYQSENKWHYFYAAWTNALLLDLLSFMAIFEVFRKTVEEFPIVRRIGTRLFFIIAIVLLLLAAALAFYGFKDIHTITNSLLLLHRSLRTILVGLIVTLFAFSSFFGLSWKHYRFGIAFGFGMFAAAELACAAYGASAAMNFRYLVSYVDQSACQFSLLLWLVYFLKHDPKVIGVPHPSDRQNLDQWRHALSGITDHGLSGGVN
jgi:hypothetical protein